MTWASVLANAPTYASLLATIVTAVATYFLWRVTAVLAVETKRMADASSQPHVVATLEPTRVSLIHFDVRIDNTGNATAYDIKVEFDPPLLKNDSDDGKAPLQNISLLRPGAKISSYLTEYGNIKEKTYNVKISWTRGFGKLEREFNSYKLSMLDIENVSRLGEDPMLQAANALKSIREDWKPIAQGNKHLKVDHYDRADRLEKELAWERHRAKMQASGDPSVAQQLAAQLAAESQKKPEQDSNQHPGMTTSDDKAT